MTNKNTTNSDSEKKPYEAPDVKQVKMVVEEALVPGCKTPASNGPTIGTCLAPTCFNPGS